ncbi:MAG: Hsp70 family protein [Anaerolineales bacterium]|nr:Hsp70 family protein [Anaerolineales bacterium]
MHIGIDFGTTHTTAAFYDGEKLRFLVLDRANRDPHLLRSMLYITKEQEVLLGLRAVEQYLRDNTGRLVRFEEKFVGTITNMVARTAASRGPTDPDGPIVIVQDVWVEEDVGALGRLIQSVKTGLRDAAYEGTRIFGEFYSVQALIALLLRQVRREAEAQLGGEVTAVTLGRPVKFATTPEEDAFAEQRLREAAELAGFEQIDFAQEPVAAALFYTLGLTEPKRLLVFDFGGGTLDLTVMGVNGRSQTDILATQGVLVGGDDMDRAIMRGKVVQAFGAGSTIDRDGHPFPAHLTALLEQWQTIPELSKANNLPIIRRAALYGNNPQAFRALECLALKNYGFALFEQIEQSKRALSVAEETRLVMNAEEIALDLLLTRREFQSYIIDELVEVQQGIQQVLEKAGLAAGDIDVVVTTGGSSLIPLFQNMLRRRFPQAEMTHSDTFGSVAAGLAIQAQRSMVIGNQ